MPVRDLFSGHPLGQGLKAIMLCDARANANAIASIADLLLQHLEHGYGRCSKLLSLFASSTLKKTLSKLCPASQLG